MNKYYLRITTYLEHIKIEDNLSRKGCSSVLFALILQDFYKFYLKYLWHNLQY